MLKELREKKKITQAQLAEIIGVSQKTVSAWERGYRDPKPAEMQKMEDYFHIKKEKIFFDLFNYLK